MPYKNEEKQKASQKKYYLENKAKYVEERKIRRRRNKEYVESLKTQCSSCGLDDKMCLDFHHLDSKFKNVSQLVNDATTLEKIKCEIDKCDVLCANCHKKHHLAEELSDGSDWVGFNKSRIEKRKWFIDLILNSNCINCNEHDRRCLEFHHLRDKLFEISYLITSGHSLNFLKEEIAKCEILCSNCHRQKHGECIVMVA